MMAAEGRRKLALLGVIAPQKTTLCYWTDRRPVHALASDYMCIAVSAYKKSIRVLACQL